MKKENSNIDDQLYYAAEVVEIINRSNARGEQTERATMLFNDTEKKVLKNMHSPGKKSIFSFFHTSISGHILQL